MPVNPVSFERWLKAQQWELAFWQRAERRAGWKALVYPVVRPVLGLFGHHRVVGDDDNIWWRHQFDGYRFLPHQLGDYIELGCGPYTNTRLILKGRRATRVVCSDPLAPHYVEFGDRWLSRAHRRGRVEIDSHPIEELPFQTGSFDTVVMINVLDHVRDVAACMNNALALLRPGGWFVLGQDIAKPAISVEGYGWFAEGHPQRVALTDITPFLERLERRYELHVAPRDPRLQDEVFALAGVRR